MRASAFIAIPSSALSKYNYNKLISMYFTYVLEVDQGGDTPIYSVLRSSSSVKMKVKGQTAKSRLGQKSNLL